MFVKADSIRLAPRSVVNTLGQPKRAIQLKRNWWAIVSADESLSGIASSHSLNGSMIVRRWLCPCDSGKRPMRSMWICEERMWIRLIEWTNWWSIVTLHFWFLTLDAGPSPNCNVFINIRPDKSILDQPFGRPDSWMSQVVNIQEYFSTKGYRNKRPWTWRRISFSYWSSMLCSHHTDATNHLVWAPCVKVMTNYCLIFWLYLLIIIDRIHFWPLYI